MPSNIHALPKRPPHLRQIGRRGAFSCLLTLLSCLFASTALGGLPPANDCPSLSLRDDRGQPLDAAPVQIHEGMIITEDQLLLLRQLIPQEVWSHREAFFHEGMRLVIGPCHRRYPPPPFYLAATEHGAEKVSLEKNSSLKGYAAGIPFPQDDIDPEEAGAGLRWAWNFVYRYRGAGPSGKFRLLDLPSGIGGRQTYRGSFAWIQTAHRADLDESDYHLEGSKKNIWVFGGRFDEPFNARHLAWRQFRPEKTGRRFDKADDIFVYVPTMRKPRRAATTWTDGLFVPSYRVTGDSGGGGVRFGTGAFGGTSGGISPTGGVSAAASENLRRGFIGMTIRPNAYQWILRGEQDVLAPINAAAMGWPLEPDRNYGPSGLSVGDDRWDVRHAVVIEGFAVLQDAAVGRLKLYVDYETLQPLYYVSYKPGGGVLDIGILLHSYSGDHPRYPVWPNGEAARVFDPVAAVFYSSGGGGWRRESYDVRSTPLSDGEVRGFLSTSQLVQGH